MTSLLTFSDAGAQTSYKVNAAAGEFGILNCSVGRGFFSRRSVQPEEAGLIFYQAGVAVLTASIFQGAGAGAMYWFIWLTDVHYVEQCRVDQYLQGCFNWYMQFQDVPMLFGIALKIFNSTILPN